VRHIPLWIELQCRGIDPGGARPGRALCGRMWLCGPPIDVECCTQHGSFGYYAREEDPDIGCCTQHARNMVPEHFIYIVKVYFKCCKDSFSMLRTYFWKTTATLFFAVRRKSYNVTVQYPN
jgi:hypothetical protein